MQVLTVPHRTDNRSTMRLARTLLTLRKRRGMTQTEVSRISGVERGYYGCLERGDKFNPSQDTLEGLARAFEISVAELLRMVGSIDEDTIRRTATIEVDPAKADRLKGLERFPEPLLGAIEALLSQVAPP